MWLFNVWFHYFFSYILTTTDLSSVPKTVEIKYAIYQGLSKRRLCKEYVGRKVNNASGFHLRRNFAFVRTPSLQFQFKEKEKTNSGYKQISFAWIFNLAFRMQQHTSSEVTVTKYETIFVRKERLNSASVLKK